MGTHYRDRDRDPSLSRTDTDVLALLRHDLSSVTSANSWGSFCEYSYLNTPTRSFISILRALLTITNFCILFIRNFFFFEGRPCLWRSFFIILSYKSFTSLYLSSFYTFIDIKHWPPDVPSLISPYDGWYQEQDAKLKFTGGTWMRHYRAPFLWLVSTIPILTLLNAFRKVQNVFLWQRGAAYGFLDLISLGSQVIFRKVLS